MREAERENDKSNTRTANDVKHARGCKEKQKIKHEDLQMMWSMREAEKKKIRKNYAGGEKHLPYEIFERTSHFGTELRKTPSQMKKKY